MHSRRQQNCDTVLASLHCHKLVALKTPHKYRGCLDTNDTHKATTVHSGTTLGLTQRRQTFSEYRLLYLYIFSLEVYLLNESSMRWRCVYQLPKSTCITCML